jgi:ABC-type sugar transport system ATPase subunit
MADSKVLLLDEPTAGIDVAARTEIHRLLRELTDAGAAVVVAIADPGELLALCDRVIVLAEGRQTLACSRPFDESDIVAASFQHAAA